jgi:hypothetical protein
VIPLSGRDLLWPDGTQKKYTSELHYIVYTFKYKLKSCLYVSANLLSGFAISGTCGSHSLVKVHLQVRGASKIKVKNVNKKRMATARRLIFFGISQGIHC